MNTSISISPPQDESLAAYYRTQDCSARSHAQKSCVNGGDLLAIILQLQMEVNELKAQLVEAVRN